MILKIFLICFSISLFGMDGENVKQLQANKASIIKLQYMNLNILDKEARDIKAFEPFFNDMRSSLIIFNGLKNNNALRQFPHTYNFKYTNSYERDLKHVIGVLDISNQFFKIKRFQYPDKNLIFKSHNITGYKINDRAIIVINFTDEYYFKDIPSDLITKIKNLNFVISWITKEYGVSIDNIAIIGSFGIGEKALKGLVNEFEPALTTGTKIVKRGNEFLLAGNENVLLSKNSKFSAKINYQFKKLSHGEYLKKVSAYYPINLFFRENIKKN